MISYRKETGMILLVKESLRVQSACQHVKAKLLAIILVSHLGPSQTHDDVNITACTKISKQTNKQKDIHVKERRVCA